MAARLEESFASRAMADAERMHAAGASLRKIAASVGLSRSYIHRRLSGHRTITRVCTPERAACGPEPLTAGAGISCRAIGLKPFSLWGT